MAPMYTEGDHVRLKDTLYVGNVISYEKVASRYTLGNKPRLLLDGEVYVLFQHNNKYDIFSDYLVFGSNDDYLWRGPEWMLERIID